jgi:uncharacterized protein YdaU (DUF1376 family)
MHWYKRHIGDYGKKTAHLSLLEHGVYGALLDWSYATEQCLPPEKDSIYHICGAASAKEKRAVDKVVNEFFIPTTEGRKNKRTFEECEEYRRIGKIKRKAVRVRWDNISNTDVLQNGSEPDTSQEPRTDNPEPTTIPQEAESQKPEANAAPEIPSVEEVKTWAQMSGVDPDYAVMQHGRTTKAGMWLIAGRLADWKGRWLGFWLKDREGFMRKKNSGPPGAPLTGAIDPDKFKPVKL